MLRFLRELLGTTDGDRRRFTELVHDAQLPSGVKSALLRSLSISERSLLQRIEHVRKETEEDRRQVTVMDYGAGSSADHRAAEEMAKGVPTTRIVGEVCQVASKRPVWCEMLFKLVRYLRPVRCIEMGTCVGISASYIASALKMNGEGRLVTLEGAEALAETAKENLRSLGLSNTSVKIGRFSETLPGVLQAMAPVDFLFIDGHHDRDATLAYFRQARPTLAKANVVVFDDIDWSDGMREAWAVITHETVGFSLGNVGLCLNVVPNLTGASREEPGRPEGPTSSGGEA